MRCDEVIRRDVESVRPGDAVQRAAEKMREANIGFLPVCEDDGTLAGVLTDRDLALRVVADGLAATTPIRDVMSREDLVTCRPDDELGVAGDLMRDHQVGRVVVTDEADRLVGVISLADLVRYEPEDESVDAFRDVSDREVSTPL